MVGGAKHDTQPVCNETTSKKELTTPTCGASCACARSSSRRPSQTVTKVTERWHRFRRNSSTPANKGQVEPRGVGRGHWHIKNLLRFLGDVSPTKGTGLALQRSARCTRQFPWHTGALYINNLLDVLGDFSSSKGEGDRGRGVVGGGGRERGREGGRDASFRGSTGGAHVRQHIQLVCSKLSLAIKVVVIA